MCEWKQHVVVTHAQESDLAAPAEARSCQTPADLLLQTEEWEKQQSGYSDDAHMVMILCDSCTSGSGMMTGSLSVRVMDSWLAVKPRGEIRSFKNTQTTHFYISVFSFLYYCSFITISLMVPIASFERLWQWITLQYSPSEDGVCSLGGGTCSGKTSSIRWATVREVRLHMTDKTHP